MLGVGGSDLVLLCLSPSFLYYHVPILCWGFKSQRCSCLLWKVHKLQVGFYPKPCPPPTESLSVI